jgi:hypothetical protein
MTALSTATALLILLAGCSSVTVSGGTGGTGGTIPEARNSATTGSGGLQVHGQVHSRSLAAVILAGLLIGAALEDSREERPFPSLSAFFSDWMGNRPAPELLPGRHISEQDCSQPLDFSRGNIRCK